MLIGSLVSPGALPAQGGCRRPQVTLGTGQVLPKYDTADLYAQILPSHSCRVYHHLSHNRGLLTFSSFLAQPPGSGSLVGLHSQLPDSRYDRYSALVSMSVTLVCCVPLVKAAKTEKHFDWAGAHHVGPKQPQLCCPCVRPLSPV